MGIPFNSFLEQSALPVRLFPARDTCSVQPLLPETKSVMAPVQTLNQLSVFTAKLLDSAGLEFLFFDFLIQY